jgi:hypothetical protein
MTGPEHYLEAERLVDGLAEWTGAITDLNPVTPDETTEAAIVSTIAQVHATLALAAAVASTNVASPDGPESLADRDYRGWGEAVGVQ